MAGGTLPPPSLTPQLFPTNMPPQAPWNRQRRLSIYNLGHLAPPLPEPPSGGVLPVVAPFLELPRGDPQAHGQAAEWGG